MMLPVGRSGWAIAAGYFGLLSLIMFPAPFAILFSMLAFRDLKRNRHLHGWGRAWFGLIMGCLGTGMLILAVIGAALGN
jgi:hypothetical protein